MAARIWTKKETQNFIKRLRKAGYEVVKKQEGLYECTHEGEHVFTAAILNNRYVVRLNMKYFQGEEK